MAQTSFAEPTVIPANNPMASIAANSGTAAIIPSPGGPTDYFPSSRALIDIERTRNPDLYNLGPTRGAITPFKEPVTPIYPTPSETASRPSSPAPSGNAVATASAVATAIALGQNPAVAIATGVGGVIGGELGAGIGTVILPGVGTAIGAGVGSLVGGTLAGTLAQNLLNTLLGTPPYDPTPTPLNLTFAGGVEMLHVPSTNVGPTALANGQSITIMGKDPTRCPPNEFYGDVGVYFTVTYGGYGGGGQGCAVPGTMQIRQAGTTTFTPVDDSQVAPFKAPAVTPLFLVPSAEPGPIIPYPAPGELAPAPAPAPAPQLEPVPNPELEPFPFPLPLFDPAPTPGPIIPYPAPGPLAPTTPTTKNPTVLIPVPSPGGQPSTEPQPQPRPVLVLPPAPPRVRTRNPDCCDPPSQPPTVKIGVKKFSGCIPNPLDPTTQIPTYTIEEISVTQGEEDKVTAYFERFYSIESEQCGNQECCVAPIPDSWPVRKFGSPGQLAIVFVQSPNQVTGVGPIYYQLNLPHYSGGRVNVSPIGPYQKGQYYGILTLKDNSKVFVNCISEAECLRVLAQASAAIDPAMLTGLAPKTGQRGGELLHTYTVYPYKLAWFPNGQNDTRPEWEVKLYPNL